MNELYHYGIKRRSGRYPWGSGDRPKQRLEKKKTLNKSKGDTEKTSILIKNSIKKVAFEPLYKTFNSLISDIKTKKWTKKDIIIALILGGEIGTQNTQRDQQQMIWRQQQTIWNQQQFHNTMMF